MIAARHRMAVGDADATAGGGECLRNVRGRAMKRHCTAAHCGVIGWHISRLKALG
jgi:hypothetical protein